MKKNQKIVTASVTVLAAVATAHLMQRGTQASPSLTEPAPVQMAAIGPAAIERPAIRLPVVNNPVTVRAPALVPAPQAEADEPARPEDSVPDIASDTTDAVVTEIERAVPEGAEEPDLASIFPEMPRPPEDGLMPDPLPLLGPELKERMSSVDAVAEDGAAMTEPPQAVRRNAFGLSCGSLLTAAPRDAAMVALTLTDPCRGDEVFTLRHGQLVFTAKTDSLGTYSAQVPALDPEARYVITFADASEVEAEVLVPDAADVDRVAILSTGRMGLGIHALEFGADYEQSGHVWAGQTRDPETAARTGGGFLTVLGDPELPEARLAEVYTFPANTKHREGVVRLSVEVEVTAFNCGKEIAGNTLQRAADGRIAPVTLTLAMPDCDAIGEFLVLKNLLRDLKVASN